MKDTISQRIQSGELPDGYELQLEDIGEVLNIGFGRVLPIDLYKKVYLKAFGLTMENNDQRNHRKKAEYDRARDRLAAQLHELKLNQIFVRDLSYGDTDGIVDKLRQMGRVDEGVKA